MKVEFKNKHINSIFKNKKQIDNVIYIRPSTYTVLNLIT